MRGAISTPVNCDPGITKRLHEDHMKNMCNRMEEHMNKAAIEVSNHQAVLTAKVKEVNYCRQIENFVLSSIGMNFVR